MLALPADGVPARVAVPLWLSVKVTPLGKFWTVRVLASLSVGVGEPVVVTVKLPAVPDRKVVLGALVKTGTGAGLTVMPDWVPLIVLVALSVAVSDWVPAVFGVALKL